MTVTDVEHAATSLARVRKGEGLGTDPLNFADMTSEELCALVSGRLKNLESLIVASWQKEPGDRPGMNVCVDFLEQRLEETGSVALAARREFR